MSMADSMLPFLRRTYDHFKLMTSALRQGKQGTTRISKIGPILIEINHQEIDLLFLQEFPHQEHFDFGIPMIFNFNQSISILKTSSNLLPLFLPHYLNNHDSAFPRVHSGIE